MKNMLLAVAVAAALLAPAVANASVYHFGFETTDGVFTVSGVATTANTLDSAGGYDVLALTGTVSASCASSTRSRCLPELWGRTMIIVPCLKPFLRVTSAYVPALRWGS